MIKRKLRCTKCNHVFEDMVLEAGEAVARNINPRPIQCPKCRNVGCVKVA